MHRTDAPGNVANLFSDGDPLVPTLGTVVEQNSLNAFQEELANAVVLNGDVLVKGTNTQLRKLIAAIVGGEDPGGRLSLVSGDPSPSTDQANITSIYYSAYKHNVLPIYNGSYWELRAFTTMSQLASDATKSPAAVGASLNYDIFAWLDGSTLRISRGPAWTTDTTRGTGSGTTELARVSGRLVNGFSITNGPAANRGTYLGSVRSNSGATGFNDTFQIRGVWNMYNRIARALQRLDTGSWTYGVSGYRYGGGNSNNRVFTLQGLDETVVDIRLLTCFAAGAGVSAFTGIGLDSASTPTDLRGGSGFAGSYENSVGAYFCRSPGLGFHFFSWLESANGGTVTFYGNDGIRVSGLFGTVDA